MKAATALSRFLPRLFWIASFALAAVSVCSIATFVAFRLSHDEQQQLQQQGQQYFAHFLLLRSVCRRRSS